MLTLHGFTYNGFAENTYLIANEKGDCWVIDPGMNNEKEHEQFSAFLASNKFTPKGIINTHTHIDHIFGVETLMNKYNIGFSIHEGELPVLKNAKGAAMLFGFEMGTLPKPTDFIKEGEKLMLGEEELEVRLTPGHSPGSISFYYPAGKWVISGDALFAGSIGRTDLPGGNHDQLIKAIKTQLLTLPAETKVFSGHGPDTTIGKEAETNPFF